MLSLVTYSFLDGDIYAAYTSPQYTFEMLPELADYDRMEYFVQRSFGQIDVFSGAPKQHVFFALVKVFGESNRCYGCSWRVLTSETGWELALLVITMIVRAGTVIFAPVGINRLLKFEFPLCLPYQTLSIAL